MAGNFHSEALQLVERYTLMNANEINYEVTVQDAKVFTRPWTMAMRLHRVTDETRLFEYQCQSEAEEANGAFERDPKTRYPGPSVAAAAASEWKDEATTAEGTGADGGDQSPAGRKAGSPGLLPVGRWRRQLRIGASTNATSSRRRGAASSSIRLTGCSRCRSGRKAETASRNTPERGYDDPTAHCFVAGVPRSMYVPGYMQILQPPGYVVILHERMSWRIIPLEHARASPGRVPALAGRFGRPMGSRGLWSSRRPI